MKKLEDYCLCICQPVKQLILGFWEVIISTPDLHILQRTAFYILEELSVLFAQWQWALASALQITDQSWWKRWSSEFAQCAKLSISFQMVQCSFSFRFDCIAILVKGKRLTTWQNSLQWSTHFNALRKPISRFWIIPPLHLLTYWLLFQDSVKNKEYTGSCSKLLVQYKAAFKQVQIYSPIFSSWLRPYFNTRLMIYSLQESKDICNQVQGDEFPTVETFMAKYRLDAPAALERIKVT